MLKQLAEALGPALARQAAAHAVTMSSEQANAIARNLVYTVSATLGLDDIDQTWTRCEGCSKVGPDVKSDGGNGAWLCNVCRSEAVDSDDRASSEAAWLRAVEHDVAIVKAGK